MSEMDYAEFVLDQLTALRDVTSGRFFGGIGLSSSGTQFAMIMENSVYFVVDDATRQSYEKMGSRCFSYSTKKRRVAVKKYYEVPAELIEDQDRLVALARESIRVAEALKTRPAVRKKSSR